MNIFYYFIQINEIIYREFLKFSDNILMPCKNGIIPPFMSYPIIIRMEREKGHCETTVSNILQNQQ